MKAIGFNDGWRFCHEGKSDWISVKLPHDAMLHDGRDPKSPGKDACGYFVGGVYVYEKNFMAPTDAGEKHLELSFGGIYRNSSIFVNGILAGGRPYGYSPFSVSLDGLLKAGEENTIRVVADNSQQPNSRWYSGGGIYRGVQLLTSGREYIKQHGLKITTVSIKPPVIRVDVDAAFESDVDYRIRIFDGETLCGEANDNHAVIELPGAALWSAETPVLYCCEAELLRDGDVLDREITSFGIRALSWDAKEGFRVNGRITKLRGGCIHHDNGILGACSYPKAEERRVRIMKESGFNAIRMSHHPASSELLEACDRLGMYVMDETFDMWFMGKNTYDYALDFYEWHERDIASMVIRDYNHPSVVMYSIGNEVSEPAREEGLRVAHEMVEQIHRLDPTRPVTAGINLMILVMSSKGKGLYEEGGAAKQMAEKETDQPHEVKNGSLLFNTFMTVLGAGMNRMANSKKADRIITPIMDALDIAGYNYGSGRYPLEGKAHPERIVVGSETFPQDIGKNWKMVEKYPYLVGDFMWAGWDYLGEAAIGTWNYEGASMQNVYYPWLLGGGGVIDITGRPDAEAAYARQVWGQAKAPYIGVRPANHPGVRVTKSAWRGTNANDSWAWQGCEGNKTLVEVYGNGVRARLYLNGQRIAEKRMTDQRAIFPVKYQPGILRAEVVGISGNVLGTAELRSAEGELSLRVTPEETQIKKGEIVYIDLAIIGENDVIESNADRKLTVTVENGELLGFGSAKPNPTESYLDGSFPTWYGRAQAVVRANESGPIIIRATDETELSGEARIDVL